MRDSGDHGAGLRVIRAVVVPPTRCSASHREGRGLAPSPSARARGLGSSVGAVRGVVGRGRSAATRRMLARGARRWGRGAPAHRGRDRRGAVTRVARGLAVRPVVRAPARRFSHRPAQPAGAAGRAGRCARPRLGRRSGARLSTFASRGARMRDELCRGTNIQCALDSHERPLHCHHEKTIVIDDRVAFVGGIDLTAESGDRFDSSEHHARAAVGWHDVSTRIEGPAVADVSAHFRMRWREVTGETLDRRMQPADELPQAVPTRCRSFARSRRTSTRPSLAGTFGYSSRICGRCGRHGRSSTSRTSFSGRPRSRRSCAKSSKSHRAMPSESFSSSRETELRGRRHTRRTRRADRRRQRSGPPARVHALRTPGQPRRSRLRPCEGRDRRRPLAHDRLGEPERALPVQRHRDEHRLPRPGVVGRPG